MNKLKLYCWLSITFLFSIVNSYANINHWESILMAGDPCRYYVPTSEISDAWKSKEFVDLFWKNGISGLGFGDDDDQTILPKGTQCVYIRYNFSIDNLNNLDSLILDIDYDDGFVAYLNGVEVARDNILDPIKWDMELDGLHEAELFTGGRPERFILKDFMKALLVEGKNVLAVEVHNEKASSSDMSSNVFLHVGVKSDDTIYRQTPDWFWAPVYVPEIRIEDSSLPIMIIDTKNQIIRSTGKIVADMGLIYNGEGKTNSQDDLWSEYTGKISIKIRGESSRQYDKKSFSIETQKDDGTNNNVSLLDLPKENDFVLYGPYSDKTLIKNVLTYELYRRTGKWAPRTHYIEMIINGKYRGIYVLTEKLKRDDNRVDVDKLTSEDTSAMDITGGYILRRDKTTGLESNEYWNSPVKQIYYEPLKYQYYDPKFKDLTSAQAQYIRDWMQQFDEMMSSDQFNDTAVGYDKYIKVKSFMDMMFINEISKNLDGYMFSTYFHKESESDGGKLAAGAPWDYNIAYGNIDYGHNNNIPETHSWVYNNWSRVYWFARLMEDEVYENKVYCRWTKFRNSIYSNESIEGIIDSCTNLLGNAVDRNFEKFPTLGQYVWPNSYYPDTYEDEIVFLKEWLFERLAWIDAQWYDKGKCSTSTQLFAQSENGKASFSVYPNPSDLSNVTIRIQLQKSRSVTIHLYNTQGSIVSEQFLGHVSEGTSSFPLKSMTFLKTGLYIYKVMDGAETLGVGKIMKQ